MRDLSENGSSLSAYKNNEKLMRKRSTSTLGQLAGAFQNLSNHFKISPAERNLLGSALRGSLAVDRLRMSLGRQDRLV